MAKLLHAELMQADQVGRDTARRATIGWVIGENHTKKNYSPPVCYLDGERMDIFLNACRREFSGLFNGVQTIHQIWT